MKLIPIKLLTDESVKNTLLNLKKDNSEIDKDDYIESKILTDVKARQLLAIEDASEMAKRYLHKPGIFEKIAEDIKLETQVDFEFQCSDVSTMKFKKRRGLEYILMEVSYDDNNTGHYGVAKVNHYDKAVRLYDSMVKVESDFKTPLENLLTQRYTLTISKSHLQPTGGFVAESFEKFKDPDYSDGVPKKMLEKAFELSQYDELSQHHFCYVESLLAIMNDLGLGNPGPGDPRDRLVFIKRVVWGLIHKYTPVRNTVQWNYFETNFRYIFETKNSYGKRFKMIHGYIQIPTDEVNIRLKTLHLRDDIDEKWTLKEIVDWAAICE
jgi:hypothetical protein